MRPARNLRNIGAATSRTIQAIGATAFKDLITLVPSRRFLVITVVTAVLVVLLAFRLYSVTTTVAEGEAALALWQRGVEGSVTAFAFGFLPLVIPLVAVGLAYDSHRKNRASGFLETAMSRRAPRWSIALGGFLGQLAAVSISVLIITLVGIGIIASRPSSSVSSGLVAGILIGSLLLAALYLSLILFLTAFLTPGLATSLVTLLWFVFNLARPTSLILSGQVLLILQIPAPHTFQTGWADWTSFTGMYEGFLAHLVPDSLTYVVRPVIEDLSASLAYWSVQYAGLVALVAVVTGYLALVTRYPLGR